MIFDPPLRPALFLRRRKRFLADLRDADGGEFTAHLPNTGAMTGCAEPGGRCWYSLSEKPSRKLPATLELTECGGALICVNTQRANQVVAEALERQALTPLGPTDGFRREVRCGASRLDFELRSVAGDWLLEVKSVTLVEDGVALFPDAVSARALRHLETLEQAVAQGRRAALLFLVQRGDADCFRPADHIDPAYGAALRRVRRAGVRVLCYRSLVSPARLDFGRRVPLGFR